MRRLMWKGGFEDVPANEAETDRYLINDDGDLVIVSIVNTDSGMYTCFKYGAHESTYTIGVEDLGDRLRVGVPCSGVARRWGILVTSLRRTV